MLFKIALSSFLLSCIIPNPYGFLVKAAFYSPEHLAKVEMLLVVFLSQVASLIVNYYLGIILVKIPPVRRFIKKRREAFEKRRKQIDAFNLCVMGLGGFFFHSYIPFASFFCGVTGLKKRICFPIFCLTTVLRMASLAMRF